MDRPELKQLTVAAIKMAVSANNEARPVNNSDPQIIGPVAATLLQLALENSSIQEALLEMDEEDIP